MSSNILFIFEGPKTEKLISDNLTTFFVNENRSLILGDPWMFPR